MSIPAGNGATGASGTGPALGYTLNLFWFIYWFMLISENNINTSTYLLITLSLYIMKLLVIFGIKIYRKLPIFLTGTTLWIFDDSLVSPPMGETSWRRLNDRLVWDDSS